MGWLEFTRWHDEPNWFDRLRWWRGWYTYKQWGWYLIIAIFLYALIQLSGCESILG